MHNIPAYSIIILKLFKIHCSSIHIAVPLCTYRNLKHATKIFLSTLDCEFYEMNSKLPYYLFPQMFDR